MAELLITYWSALSGPRKYGKAQEDCFPTLWWWWYVRWWTWWSRQLCHFWDTEDGKSFHGLELELDEWDVLIIRLKDDGLGADVELALVLVLGLVGSKIMERAVAKEILDIDLILLHVIQCEALCVGWRYEQHFELIIIYTIKCPPNLTQPS